VRNNVVVAKFPQPSLYVQNLIFVVQQVQHSQAVQEACEALRGFPYINADLGDRPALSRAKKLKRRLVRSGNS